MPSRFLLIILMPFMLLAYSGCSECKPECEMRCCGDDGCGGTCPNICEDPCEGPYACDRTTCDCKSWSCFPRCLGKCCGSDGCCGACHIACPDGYNCNTDTCTCEYDPVETSCFSMGRKCGTWLDEEGVEIDCGQCPNNETCTGGDCETCKPWTCEMMDGECGDWDDGCGGTVSCGSCPDGTECSQYMTCEPCVTSELGQPCPYSHVNPGTCRCAVDFECIGSSYLGDCSGTTGCGIPEKYSPDCYAFQCGYSFCSISCETEQCPAGFVENTSLGTCYCFPES